MNERTAIGGMEPIAVALCPLQFNVTSPTCALTLGPNSCSADRFAIFFTPLTPGRHQLGVSYGSIPILTAPSSIVVTAGDLNATYSMLRGPTAFALHAGDLATVLIEGRDTVCIFPAPWGRGVGFKEGSSRESG